MSFVDMREWIARLDKEGELRRITAEVDWDRELGAIARRVLEKKGPALLFERIKGYETGRCTKLFVSGLGERRPSGALTRLPQRRVESRSGPARHEDESPDDPAEDRRDRSRQGRGRPRSGHRPDGVSDPEVALPGGRTLHPHVLRHRHARPRDARHERRHLPRHDRQEGHGAVSPHQGRPALGPAFPEVFGPRRADAGGLRGRLGPDHAVPGGLADPDRACASGT